MNSLAARVLARLEAPGPRLLLADSSGRVSDSEAGARIAELRVALESRTEPGAWVRISRENSSELVLELLSCWAAGRVPWLVSPGRAATSVPELAPAPGIALVLETSGTRGEPKAVAVPERAIEYLIDHQIRAMELNSGTRAFILHPLHHTFALNSQLLPTLIAGGEAVIHSARFALGKAFRSLVESQATFLSLVGSLVPYLEEESRACGGLKAEAVRVVQFAGEEIRTRNLAAARRLFPRARFFKAYGLTEALRVAMISSDELGLFESPATGRVLPGHEVRICDESGQPLPEGERGRIHVRGPTVMAGYLQRDDQPVDPSGFLATGDLGRLKNDLLTVEGRADLCFKKQGIKIAPAELEERALGLPAITAVKCLGLPDTEGELRIVLFVETLETAENGIAALVARLRQGLEKVKRPEYLFILTAMPRTVAGKVACPSLEALWSSRAARPDWTINGVSVHRAARETETLK